MAFSFFVFIIRPLCFSEIPAASSSLPPRRGNDRRGNLTHSMATTLKLQRSSTRFSSSSSSSLDRCSSSCCCCFWGSASGHGKMSKRPHPHPHAGSSHGTKRALKFCRSSLRGMLSALLLAAIVLPSCAIFVLMIVIPASPPPPPPKLLCAGSSSSSSSCNDDDAGFVLEERRVCTHACGELCFPRVQGGLCFAHDQVSVCSPWPEEQKPKQEMASEMRFYVDKEHPRKKVKVVQSCHGGDGDGDGDDNKVWIRGLQMVADLTLMPTGKVGPNPHHEAEKLLPAIIMSRQLQALQNSSLYWFADPHDPLMISQWSLGLLDAFSEHLHVEFLSLPKKKMKKSESKPKHQVQHWRQIQYHHQQPVGHFDESRMICFEDAILFTSMTDAGYIPNLRTHDWLRRRVLDHCGIPAMNAHRPALDAAIVHRPNSPRNIWNYEQVKASMQAKLGIDVKLAVPGPWPFCDQVKLVAEADVLLTPHGSQNANLLVARPGASIIEAFPLLYYIDWYGHYLHAARVHHFELFGTWPSSSSSSLPLPLPWGNNRKVPQSMPLLMRIYAYLYGWQHCFFVKRCMNYGKGQPVYVDLVQLDRILDIVVASSCNSSIVL